MKSKFALLLVVGILILGTFSVIDEVAEEVSFQELADFSDNYLEEFNGDPAPCGEGGGGSSGGGGVPG